MTYLPGLDGLRAVAVIAVILYHAGVRWIPGGFLGVDVFFVISGYLITSLLLIEWRKRRQIDLRAFWLRRARRLLPALFLLLAVTMAFVELFLPDEVAGLRGATLAAVGYMTNWYFVFNHQSYFEAIGRPPLLRHLWSLAIEEQFYLMWPLLFLVGLRFFRRAVVMLAILLATVATTVLMAILYIPDTDPSRLYYGTDTHSTGLLIGAGLAFLQASGISALRANALLIEAIGFAALGALAIFFLRFDEFNPILYRGGFTGVALVAAIVIAVAVDPRSRLGSVVLGWKPLRWIGQQSYGLYLWHWPIFMLTRPQLDVPLQGLPLMALRLAITMTVVLISFRYVETPFRNGALEKAWRGLRQWHGRRLWWLRVQWGAAAGAILALSISAAYARPVQPPAYLYGDGQGSGISFEAISSTPIDSNEVAAITVSGSVATDQVNLRAGPGTRYQVLTVLYSGERLIVSGKSTNNDWLKVQTGEGLEGWAFFEFLQTDESIDELPVADVPSLSPSPNGPSTPPAQVATPPVNVTAIGDSVMLGAASQLEQAIGSVDVDAAVGRQASAAVQILQARRSTGELGDVVVIQIGNNGPISATQFDELMRVLSGVRRVVVVSLKVPREWEDHNNEVLAQGVSRYPNAVFVDWYSIGNQHPEYFWDDGIHLRPEGAKVYAALIAAQASAE